MADERAVRLGDLAPDGRVSKRTLIGSSSTGGGDQPGGAMSR